MDSTHLTNGSGAYDHLPVALEAIAPVFAEPAIDSSSTSSSQRAAAADHVLAAEPVAAAAAAAAPVEVLAIAVAAVPAEAAAVVVVQEQHQQQQHQPSSTPAPLVTSIVEATTPVAILPPPSATTSVFPPAPITALPPHLEPAAPLERVDSTSSLLVEPPSSRAPTPSSAAPLASTPLPLTAAVTHDISAASSAAPSPLPTPPPPAAAAAISPAVLEIIVAAQSDVDTPMEDGTAPSTVPTAISPVNKRSAPEEEKGVVGESAGTSAAGFVEEEREAKRQRVEVDPIVFTPAPTPLAAAAEIPLAHQQQHQPIPLQQQPQQPTPYQRPVSAEPIASTSAPVAALPSIATYNAASFSTPSDQIATPSLASPYTVVPSAQPFQNSTISAEAVVATAPQPSYDQVAAPAAFTLAPAAQAYEHTPSAFADQPLPVAAAAPVYGQPLPDAAAAAPIVPESEGPIAAMTKEQQKFILSLVRGLKKHRDAGPFTKPVDVVAAGVPDYYKIITEPTDLNSIENRLNATGRAIAAASKLGRTFGIDYSGYGHWEGKSPTVYRTAADFRAEIERLWLNCYRYNGPKDKNKISEMASTIEEQCEKSWRNLPPAPLIDYKPLPPRQASAEPKKEQRRTSGGGFAYPPARRSEDGPRPKREIHAPARDLPDGAGRRGRVSGKGAQEQLKYCKEVIREMFKKTHESYAFVFYNPVDYITLNIPSYPDVVRHPMDLGTIRTKLEQNAYPVPPYAAFEADMRLIFSNCYIFNPPGTPVHGWGQQTEQVFEDKWSVRPSGEDHDDDPASDDELAGLERQMSDLQSRIDSIKADRAASKAAARKAAAAARPPKVSVPKKASSGEHRPKSQPQQRRKSTTASANGNGMKKKHKSNRDDSEEKEEIVTFEMKRELAVKITNFEGDNLERAIDIIRMGRPDLLSDENKEIELDIDQLDQRTLLSLYRFVCPQSRPAAKMQMKKRTKPATGGPKRKNTDETKESQRIEMLEARLRDFEGAGGESSRRGSGVMGGGDQASSDSSSAAGSDSESEASD